MLSEEKNKLMQDFERELWFYLDGDLPESRKKFWDEHLSKNSELLEYFNETKAVLNLYQEYSFEEVEESRYNEIIWAATKKAGIIAKVKSIFSQAEENKPGVAISKPMLAFAAMLIIASIVLLSISREPNAVKNVSSEILEWDAKSITNTIDKMGVSISYLKNDNFYDYYNYQQTSDKWSQDVYFIKKEIEDLKNETTIND